MYFLSKKSEIQILLQCSICSLYRKEITLKKKKKQSYLPTYPNSFEHVTSNIYVMFFGPSLYEQERTIEEDCYIPSI